ncbi:hypothetical protein GUITHDRAFT_121399 [Guillardia theta CCMP2712]|uniref:Uncharacterized protein n=1 Tax=Guillardia theta (strain CCMP2712) TaxID=905079 RepID=L1I956_GUITC|nr:hypothetical protein GUITHDRAFT_121399 [Guillardia theta CCMP2712]EKX32434.1 hypothetical protein GUITHDRAFT_121399 [Guillardia theta CCMP2712]|eukprot:XP_005819414.1 hypothetical protein GUITHDRAFT_121399 [Guillardia theta CCMP2712]
MESRLTQDPPLENIPYRGDGGITAKECCSVQFSGAQGRQEKISLRYSDDGLMLVFPLEGREASRQRGKDETRMHGKATCASVNKKETMEKKLVKKSVARSSAASKGKTDSETRVRSCLKPEVKSRIDKGKQSWKKLKPADIQTHSDQNYTLLLHKQVQTLPLKHRDDEYCQVQQHQKVSSTRAPSPLQ